MSDPSLSGVVITSREIYDAVVRLTGSVDLAIKQLHETDIDLKDHEARLRAIEKVDVIDHGARIRDLEKGRWPIPALTIVLSVIAVGIAVAERIWS